MSRSEHEGRAWAEERRENARLARLGVPAAKRKPKPKPSLLSRMTSRITPWGLVVTTFWIMGLMVASKLVPWAAHATGIWP